nr:zinc finger MYM-type protein 1-like [Parasteatoda tepidariorum]
MKEIVLQESKIPLETLVGRSYDGALNMRVDFKGLKTLIQEVAPKAQYIWCSSHRFNFAINTVGKSSIEMKRAIDMLEDLCVFISGFTRNAVFVEEQGNGQCRSLKRVQTTRFSSTKDAVTTIIKTFTTVISTLKRIIGDPHMEHETVTKATGLLHRVQDINFVVSLHIIDKIFTITSSVTILMQGVAVDLAQAAQLLEICKFGIRKLRENVDTSWKKIWELSCTFSETHGIDTEINRRQMRVPHLPGENCRDERLHGEELLKTSLYIVALDGLSIQLEDLSPEKNLTLYRQVSLF